MGEPCTCGQKARADAANVKLSLALADLNLQRQSAGEVFDRLRAQIRSLELELEAERDARAERERRLRERKTEGFEFLDALSERPRRYLLTASYSPAWTWEEVKKVRRAAILEEHDQIMAHLKERSPIP